jgi:hypothetical protein
MSLIAGRSGGETGRAARSLGFRVGLPLLHHGVTCTTSKYLALMRVIIGTTI